METALLGDSMILRMHQAWLSVQDSLVERPSGRASQVHPWLQILLPATSSLLCVLNH